MFGNLAKRKLGSCFYFECVIHLFSTFFLLLYQLSIRTNNKGWDKPRNERIQQVHLNIDQLKEEPSHTSRQIQKTLLNSDPSLVGSFLTPPNIVCLTPWVKSPLMSPLAAGRWTNDDCGLRPFSKQTRTTTANHYSDHLQATTYQRHTVKWETPHTTFGLKVKRLEQPRVILPRFNQDK